MVINEFIACHSPFAVFHIDYLSRTIHGVWTQGQTDNTRTLSCMFQQCYIFLFYLMADELLLQWVVCIRMLCYEEQAAGAHIEAMDYDAAGIALVHDSFYAVVLDAPRY